MDNWKIILYVIYVAVAPVYHDPKPDSDSALRVCRNSWREVRIGLGEVLTKCCQFDFRMLTARIKV